MFAPDETFQKVPDAWIGVCERDILRDEGVFYGEKLRKFGKKAEVVVYQNAPHPIVIMDGEQTLPYSVNYSQPTELTGCVGLSRVSGIAILILEISTG